MVSTMNDFTANPASGGQRSMCCSPGSFDLERVHFFARQLVGADDLTQDQRYFRAKARRHNRFLHGWGVVCGAEVTATSEEWTVAISAGYILSPEGDEILIDCPIKVDISRQGLDGSATICGQDSDPWCTSVRVDRRVGQTLFLAVSYAEFQTRPVRVQPTGCSCGAAD
jgi:hypothetical protein